MTNISCSLPASDRPARTEAFRRLLSDSLIRRERSEHTVVWTLRHTPETAGASHRLAELERRCCDGVTFTLSTSPEQIEWRISGPATAAPVLDAFYQLPEWVQTDAGALRLWEALDAGLCGTRTKGAS